MVAPRLLAAYRGLPTDVPPVWFMRQAGRSLPEYRALRERHTILDLCRNPELAAEVTAQPVRRHGVDAAILFSDIVVPLLAMSIDLDLKEGVGPVVYEPVASRSDLQRIRDFDPAVETAFVLRTIEGLKDELDVPLIGFAGAPFTLACYLIEGGPSKHQERTKALMYSEPGVFVELLERLAGPIAAFLRAQLEAGADAVQLFDSWVGTLGPSAFETYVLPVVRTIFSALGDLDAPLVYFGLNTGELLGSMATSGADVIGVDWRVPLDRAREVTGGRVALQGNLDPAVCLAPFEVVKRQAADVLARGGGRGHVFNLGHGVLPETDPDVLTRLVEFVHSAGGGSNDGSNDD